MRLRIFLSWSGERSRLLAEALLEWLPKVLQAAAPWMSKQIPKGERWSQKIGEKLEQYHVGVICVTPENSAAPWLLFEAGAISKALGHARVCPLLLGVRPSELTGPLGQFQATLLEKTDLFELVRTLNAQLAEEAVDAPVLRGAFNREWPALERKVKQLTKVQIPATAMSVPTVIRAFAKYGVPEPALGSAAYFASGFESHSVYSAVCDAATQRLNVFGRKNRKLFDKEHSDFFSTLRSRVHAGFDFRCLFLDPAAPLLVLSAAHEAKDFARQLQDCIDHALRTLSASGLDSSRHCRAYRIHRNASILVADDAVLYAPIKLTKEGSACALTKCAFTVVNSTSQLGSELVDAFETVWEGARPLNL